MPPSRTSPAPFHTAAAAPLSSAPLPSKTPFDSSTQTPPSFSPSAPASDPTGPSVHHHGPLDPTPGLPNRLQVLFLRVIPSIIFGILGLMLDEAARFFNSAAAVLHRAAATSATLEPYQHELTPVAPQLGSDIRSVPSAPIASEHKSLTFAPPTDEPAPPHETLGEKSFRSEGPATMSVPPHVVLEEPAGKVAFSNDAPEDDTKLLLENNSLRSEGPAAKFAPPNGALEPAGKLALPNDDALEDDAKLLGRRPGDHDSPVHMETFDEERKVLSVKSEENDFIAPKDPSENGSNCQGTESESGGFVNNKEALGDENEHLVSEAVQDSCPLRKTILDDESKPHVSDMEKDDCASPADENHEVLSADSEEDKFMAPKNPPENGNNCPCTEPESEGFFDNNEALGDENELVASKPERDIFHAKAKILEDESKPLVSDMEKDDSAPPMEIPLLPSSARKAKSATTRDKPASARALRHIPPPPSYDPPAEIRKPATPEVEQLSELVGEIPRSAEVFVPPAAQSISRTDIIPMSSKTSGLSNSDNSSLSSTTVIAESGVQPATSPDNTSMVSENAVQTTSPGNISVISDSAEGLDQVPFSDFMCMDPSLPTKRGHTGKRRTSKAGDSRTVDSRTASSLVARRVSAYENFLAITEAEISTPIKLPMPESPVLSSTHASEAAVMSPAKDNSCTKFRASLSDTAVSLGNAETKRSTEFHDQLSNASTGDLSSRFEGEEVADTRKGCPIVQPQNMTKLHLHGNDSREISASGCTESSSEPVLTTQFDVSDAPLGVESLQELIPEIIPGVERKRSLSPPRCFVEDVPDRDPPLFPDHALDDMPEITLDDDTIVRVESMEKLPSFSLSRQGSLASLQTESYSSPNSPGRKSPGQAELQSASHKSPGEVELQSLSCQSPGEAELQSPGRTPPGRAGMKSQSRKSSSRAELKSPSRKPSGWAELQSVSRKSSGRAQLKSPSCRSPGQAELKSPSRKSPSRAGVQSHSHKSPGRAELRSASRKSSDQAVLPSPSRKPPGQAELQPCHRDSWRASDHDLFSEDPMMECKNVEDSSHSEGRGRVIGKDFGSLIDGARFENSLVEDYDSAKMIVGVRRAESRRSASSNSEENEVHAATPIVKPANRSSWQRRSEELDAVQSPPPPTRDVQSKPDAHEDLSRQRSVDTTGMSSSTLTDRVRSRGRERSLIPRYSPSQMSSKVFLTPVSGQPLPSSAVGRSVSASDGHFDDWPEYQPSMGDPAVGPRHRSDISVGANARRRELLPFELLHGHSINDNYRNVERDMPLRFRNTRRGWLRIFGRSTASREANDVRGAVKNILRIGRRPLIADGTFAAGHMGTDSAYRPAVERPNRRSASGVYEFSFDMELAQETVFSLLNRICQECGFNVTVRRPTHKLKVEVPCEGGRMPMLVSIQLSRSAQGKGTFIAMGRSRDDQSGGPVTDLEAAGILLRKRLGSHVEFIEDSFAELYMHDSAFRLETSGLKQG